VGLLALMLLHDSRRDARTRDGQLITLEDQDRTLWCAQDIAEGVRLLERVVMLRQPGPYQLQAAIAALHAQAKKPQETDWKQISLLYQRLLQFNDTVVIALNHAVAIAMSEGFAEGLKRIDALSESGKLDQYYLFHAARADILRRMNCREESAIAYQRA